MILYISLSFSLYIGCLLNVIGITIHAHMYLVTMHICCTDGCTLDLFISLFTFALRP